MRTWLGVGAAMLVATVMTAAIDQTGTKYGEGVSLQEPTAIAELVAHPEQYVGKRLRVDGIVTAVCQNMGCWMQLQQEGTEHAVRIKVDDGVIVFPVTAKGKRASAEGIFERVDAKAEAEHHASMGAEHQHAEPHDEAPAAYQLKATGAIVH